MAEVEYDFIVNLVDGRRVHIRAKSASDACRIAAVRFNTMAFYAAKVYPRP
jgi:hypothetical protein